MFKSLILIIISLILIVGILTLIYFTPVTVVLITISFIATILFAYYKYIEKDDKFANAGLTFFLPFTATLFVLYNQFPIILQESVYKKIGILFVIIILITIFSLNKEIKKGEKSFLEKWGSSFITILIFVFIWSLYSDNTIESYFTGESSIEFFQSIGEGKKNVNTLYTDVVDLADGETAKCKYPNGIDLDFSNYDKHTIIMKRYDLSGVYKSLLRIDNKNATLSYDYNKERISFSTEKPCISGDCKLSITYKEKDCK